jgi:hypothetical protein
VALVEAYCKEQGLFAGPGVPEAEYSEIVALDLATVEPSVAGPKRPQDRVRLGDVKKSFTGALPSLAKPKKPGAPAPVVSGQARSAEMPRSNPAPGLARSHCSFVAFGSGLALKSGSLGGPCGKLAAAEDAGSSASAAAAVAARTARRPLSLNILPACRPLGGREEVK